MNCYKITYSSRTEANQVANQMRQTKRTKRAAALRAYQCQHCGKFHLTSWDQKRKK